MDLAGAPVIHVCGYSGAGKTTLVLELIARLRQRGLRVLVLKHDAHGMSVDRVGKDTARCFAAGADVLARDATQGFARYHEESEPDPAAIIGRELPHYDFVLVEGYKRAILPNRIWLRRSYKDTPPSGEPIPALDLDRSSDRPERAWSLVTSLLERDRADAPLFAGILVGGHSSRMGTPKQLLPLGGRTWLEHIVDAAAGIAQRTVLLGRGEVPSGLGYLAHLPDAPDHEGPVAGMIAALRWQPRARWIISACDTPLLSAKALAWLVAQGRPGVCAVLPRRNRDSRPEPFPGFYGPGLLAALEQCRGPAELVRHAGVLSPVLPARLSAGWHNANTPVQAARLWTWRLQATRTTSRCGGTPGAPARTRRPSASI